MKASELIVKLQKTVEIYGNLDVFISLYTETDHPIAVDDVDIEKIKHYECGQRGDSDKDFLAFVIKDKCMW